MASYIHGTGAKARTRLEGRTIKKKKAGCRKNVKEASQYPQKTRNVPCTWTCHMLSC